MVDIRSVFSIKRCKERPDLSLCGYLEAIIGRYYLYQAGDPEAFWYAIYYDPTIDSEDECVEIIEKNLIGYVYCDERIAFILNDFLECFAHDTAAYKIPMIGVNSLTEECLECTEFSDYRTQLLPALWLDDDFMNDEDIPFDYEKFELIDAGVPYLNPKHFSVKQFVKYCELDLKSE